MTHGRTLHPTRRTLLAAALMGAAFGAAAQAPKGPVRLTSAFPSGSGPDVVARIAAEKLQARWGVPVLVEARPGGAGVLAVNAVKQQPPTGQDLVVVDVGTLSINPLVFRKLAYDPEQDLVPVAVLYRTAFFVAVAADGPLRTLKDLLAAATKPGATLRYGSNAVAGPIHLSSARLEAALGVEMQHVPYKETAQLYAGVATGEVDWAYGSIATTAPLVRAGKLRLLAVADAARSPAMPQVPTLAEAGGPAGADAQSWVAVMAPRGTPAALADELNRAILDALAQPDAQEKLAAFGFATVPATPRQLAELMRAERQRYAQVLTRVKVAID